MPDATFAAPDLTTFCRLDELGLVVVGQRLEPDRAVLACRVVEPDDWCRRCGCEGAAARHGDPSARARAVRAGGRPCWRSRSAATGARAAGMCGARTPAAAAEPRAKLSRRGLRWALEGIVVAAPHRGPGRRGPGGVVEHRQRRGPGRGPAGPDRRSRTGSTASPRSASTSTCVRHEALLYSDGGERPASLGRRSGRVKLAAACPGGTPGVGGSSRDKVRTVQYYRMGRVW